MSEKPVLSLSIKRAVELSGLSRSKLYELIQAGDLPIRKCGSRTIIRYVDLKAFIDALPSSQSEGGDYGEV